MEGMVAIEDKTTQAEKTKEMDLKKQQQIRMRDRRMYLLQEGIKSGEPKISLKVLLQKKGLGKYYHFFRDLGYDLIDMYALKGDAECEEMLFQIERKFKIKLPPKDRVLMWKVLRYRHFNAPIAQKRYIERSEIPGIILSKKDHKIRDGELDFSQLDSDRQRQVIRKYIFDVKEGRRMVQLEIYERHIDTVYNLKDLQRSIKEWQNRDPRFMHREDAREEVFMRRIRTLEEQVTIRLTKERNADDKKKRLLLQLTFLRLCLFALALYCIFLTLSYAQTMPGPLVMYFFIGSDKGQKMFVSGNSFFMGGIFCLGLQKKRSTQLLRDRLVRMHSVCKKLHNYLVSFRLASNEQRMDKMTTELDEMIKELALEDDIDWAKYKRQKSNFNSWFASKSVRHFNPAMTQEDVEESYNRLPRQTVPLAKDGDRLAVKIGKLRDLSNPHKRGREVRRGSHTSTSELLSGFYDHDKNMREITEHEDRITRREQRYQSYLDEGFEDSDISSADLWTTSSEGSDDDKNTKDLEEEDYLRFGVLPPRSFTPPGAPKSASEESSSSSAVSSSSSESKPLTKGKRTLTDELAQSVQMSRTHSTQLGRITERGSGTHASAAAASQTSKTLSDTPSAPSASAPSKEKK